MSSEILHIGLNGPLLTRYFKFLEDHFDTGSHHYLSLGGEPLEATGISHSQPPGARWMLEFFARSRKARKIIIHGLFKARMILALGMCPWLLERCYWVVWGGDLYPEQSGLDHSRFIEAMRRRVIKGMGHLLTYIPGDFEHAQSRYQARGRLCDCIMYPSNVFSRRDLPEKKETRLTVLLGNSATASNRHEEALALMKSRGLKMDKLICPLAYGDTDYADRIEATGREMYPDSFRAMRDFMPLDDYLSMLGDVDVAVFANDRQQAMGNIISLLGYGKKVYLRTTITPWGLFQKLGVKVYPLDDMDFSPVPEATAARNQAIIADSFSEARLREQWQQIFSSTL